MLEKANNISKKIDKISENSGQLITCLVILLATVVFYGAFMRYLVRDMPSWAYEVAIFLYGTIAFFSGAYCLLHDKHVSVDIIKVKMSKKNKNKLDLLYSIISLITLFIITIYASIWAYDSTLILERSEHQTTFNPQIWWFKWVVVLALVLVIMQLFSKIVKLLTRDGD